MRCIAKRAEICVVWSGDEDSAARTEQPVELLHRPNHVRYVLYDVYRPDFAECITSKRVREVIQLNERVRRRSCV